MSEYRAGGGQPDDQNDENDEVDDEVDPDLLAAASRAGEEIDAGDLDVDDAPAPDLGTDFSRTREPRASQQESPPGSASLTDILGGHVPVLVVHKSHRHSQHLPEVLGVARRQVGNTAGLGVAVGLSKKSAPEVETYLASCSSAALKIADPEIHTIPSAGSPTPQPTKAVRNHPWMASVPTAVELSWVDKVLTTQAEAGANVFLSASGWVGDLNGRQQLAAAMDWVRASRQVLGDDSMFVNLTMSASWLTDPGLRSALKQEITESNERLWWLRFYWPVVEPRYGQLANGALLDGYRDIATTAELEEKILILPNSGLTGWIATAWGARGFSTGTSWTEQMFGAQPIRRNSPGRTRPAPVERYFDATILHSVPHAVHLSLAGEPNYLTCRCRFCRRLEQLNVYDQPTADLHYLLQCAALTSALSGQRPSHRALRRVRDAMTFVAGLPAPLSGPSRPQHLPVWETRLP